MGGRSFCIGKDNLYSDGVFYRIKIRDYSHSESGISIILFQEKGSFFCAFGAGKLGC